MNFWWIKKSGDNDKRNQMMITIGAKTVNVSVYSFYDLNVHVSEFPSGVLPFIQKLFVASEPITRSVY